MSTHEDTGLLLEVHGLRSGYPEGFTLELEGLEVRRGEIVGLLGPNGSGKSTLLKLVAGLLPVRSGKVRFAGRPAAQLDARDRARRLAYVPQTSQTPFRASVIDVLTLGRYPHVGSLGRVRQSDRERIEAAMAACRLEDLAERDIQTLSGGERQRVMLARALAQDAPLLLLDEPVSNLDIRYQQESYELLRRLAQRTGLGILLADHHINLQAAYCDRLMVLRDGRAAAQGPPGELIRPGLIRDVFGLEMRVERTRAGHPFCSWIVPMPRGSDGGDQDFARQEEAAANTRRRPSGGESR
ncbi:MAG: ATP-binding cassette domain-containing protein [Candidatus Eisenbacteria bacterium]|nr:ATP-binding cassette domain-containing protein [Candidatus Eisenbacteria bacterium]